jgi:hypothetical protein
MTGAVIFVVLNKAFRKEMINIPALILQLHFVSISDWLNVHINEKPIFVNGF